MALDENLSKEEGARGIRQGFAKVLRNVAFECSAPIYWLTSQGRSRGPIINNGTIFFVDAGDGPIGVTARHVIEQYRKACIDSPQIICEIAGFPIDPLRFLIAEDPFLDIATLRVDGDQLQQIGKIAHINPREWPPKPPEVGKGVFLGGYPGKYRSEWPGVIKWVFAGGLDIAANIHDDHISIAFSREDWVKEEGVEWPTQGESWGGVSGAPVFAVVQNGVVSWRLAGVATEFHSNFEILRASSLLRVCPNGFMETLP